jgi:hypothetical protein
MEADFATIEREEKRRYWFSLLVYPVVQVEEKFL